MITHDRSKRLPSGGRNRSSYTKRVLQQGNNSVMTKVAPTIRRTSRTKGGDVKVQQLSTDVVNLYDPKTKKYSKAKLKTIVSNTANRHFVRRNILTRGCVVDTDKGQAKITSRPGQTGTLNAVLI